METRDRLLQTATDLFLGKGYGVVGTSEICRTAGINKGTFYHFFPSKSALLAAAIAAYAEEFRRDFAAISAGNKPPLEKLQALFDVPARKNADWKKAQGYAQGCLVGNMALELASVDEAVRAAVQDAMLHWRHAIEPVVISLINGGDIPPIDPAEGAELVVGLIQGGIVMAKSQNDPGRIGAMAKVAPGALSGLPPI